eukprot:TRINITY_DN4189_c0_g1_i1.p1 TRINITY_DN4189_c0_g1~~TRINITY_DN4189_c0_g1_i1.p1  ORF type:complete len:337 (-),score=30.07 TRINITY_DN4189_c0_g1_i1:36-1046(-)
MELTRICVIFFIFTTCVICQSKLPLVVNTWPYKDANDAAWDSFQSGGSRLDAVEKGCTQCEIDQCELTVGYGGSPDENGETTLDALIMDGVTMDAGSVGCLRRVKGAIAVARAVMEHTHETLIVGDLATNFAKQMGFQETSLSTPTSQKMHEDWLKNNCQPNYWANVLPNSSTSCGPYKPVPAKERVHNPNLATSEYNHDTIAMIAIDANGDIAVGTSTNGARFKIPGRVGDSPIIGAGAYVDNELGGCGATGDGDVMMRFLPCYHAVLMLKTMTPTQAAQSSINQIKAKFPNFTGALIVANKQGDVGAAGHNWIFQYTFQNPSTSGPQIVTVNPI